MPHLIMFPWSSRVQFQAHKWTQQWKGQESPSLPLARPLWMLESKPIILRGRSGAGQRMATHPPWPSKPVNYPFRFHPCISKRQPWGLENCFLKNSKFSGTLICVQLNRLHKHIIHGSFSKKKSPPVTHTFDPDVWTGLYSLHGRENPPTLLLYNSARDPRQKQTNKQINGFSN